MPRDAYTLNNDINENGLPPLVSHIQRQLRYIGESTGRLARWVIGHGGLALSISQAARLPSLSRAFDYIRSKAITDSAKWRRTLDLPWTSGSRQRGQRLTGRTRGVADRQPGLSPQPDGPYPDILLQASTDASEIQPDDAAAETHAPATDETYPMINTGLLSPPPAVRRPLNITAGLPPAAGEATPPLRTGKIPATRYLKGPGEPRLFARKQAIIRSPGEAYPAIMKELTSPSQAGVRPPDTAPERPRHARALSSSVLADISRSIDGAKVEDGAEIMEPGGGMITPEVPRSYQIPRAGTGPTGTSEIEPAEAVRPPLHTYLSQKLSRVLRPITREMTSQQPPLGIHPQASGEGVSGSHAHDIPDIPAIWKSDAPAGPAVRTIRPPASSKLAKLSKPESILQPPTARTGPPASGEVPKITGASIIPKKPAIQEESARPVGQAADAAKPEKSARHEDAEAPPGAALPGPVTKPGQARLKRAALGPPVPIAVQKAGALYEVEGGTDRGQRADALNPVGLEYLGINRSLTGGHPDTALLSRAASPVKKYTRKQGLELPVASSTVRDVQSGSRPGEELLANIHPAIPGVTAARYPNVPELALAPVGGPPAAASSQVARAETESAESSQSEGESTPAPDIDAIARDVYRILKRRLMAERERALGIH